MEGTRFELRKKATHEQIQRASLELILDSGLDRFNLDDAAVKADVSRATLFNHFHSKEALIKAAVMPLFDQSMDKLETLASSEQEPTIDDVAELCLELWKEHRDRIGFAGDMAALEDYPSLAGLRGKFKVAFIRVMRRIGKTLPLRGNDPSLCASLVLGCFVPILNALGRENGDARQLSSCLAALIEGASRGQGSSEHPIRGS